MSSKAKSTSKKTAKKATKQEPKQITKVQGKKPAVPNTTGQSTAPKATSSSPYRESSAYHAIYTILLQHKNGIRRDELVKLAAQKTGKDLKHAGYDVAVVISPKDGNAGIRHRSAKDGYWVRREHDHLTLMID